MSTNYTDDDHDRRVTLIGQDLAGKEVRISTTIDEVPHLYADFCRDHRSFSIVPDNEPEGPVHHFERVAIDGIDYTFSTCPFGDCLYVVIDELPGPSNPPKTVGEIDGYHHLATILERARKAGISFDL